MTIHELWNWWRQNNLKGTRLSLLASRLDHIAYSLIDHEHPNNVPAAVNCGVTVKLCGGYIHAPLPPPVPQLMYGHTMFILTCEDILIYIPPTKFHSDPTIYSSRNIIRVFMIDQ